MRGDLDCFTQEHSSTKRLLVLLSNVRNKYVHTVSIADKTYTRKRIISNKDLEQFDIIRYIAMPEPISFTATLNSDLGWKLCFAYIAGFIGSLAYVSALYFKFIGRSHNERMLILQPFLNSDDSIHIRKLIWYCSMGGLIAVVFQYPEQTFVPVQNFLFGVSWPAIVSQHISGRMKDPTDKEIDDYTKPEATRDAASKAKSELEAFSRLFDK